MAYLCEAVLQFAGSARNGTYLVCRWVCERSRGVLRSCEANDGDPPGRASHSETPAPNCGQARRDRRGVRGDKAEEAEEDGCVLTCFLNKQLKEESPQPPRSRRALPEEATPLPRQSALRNEGNGRLWMGDMCFPFSPNTSTKKSEAPFTIAGIFSKDGLQLTNPVIYR